MKSQNNRFWANVFIAFGAGLITTAISCNASIGTTTFLGLMILLEMYRMFDLVSNNKRK